MKREAKMAAHGGQLWTQWTLKRLERYLFVSGLRTEWSRHWGSHVGQKHAWEKIVLNFCFSWTVSSNKYTVVTPLSSTLLRTKKENCQKIRNLGEVFHIRSRVLSRRGLGWPANWPTYQPPWWLQNTVCRYRSSLFTCRVQCLDVSFSLLRGLIRQF